MSDTTVTSTAPPEDEFASAAALAGLTRRVRRHKVWLIVLTVFVALTTLMACAAAGFYAITFGGLVAAGPTVTDEQVESTRVEFEDGFGDQIESLDVRVVSVKYGSAPFPYSLFDSGAQESVYVECRLKGTDVLIADMVGVSYGYDASSSGMIPTEGSLESRMSEEQFAKLLEAFAAESREPLGSVRRYNDQLDMMYDGTSPAEVLLLSGTEYKTAELWSAMEGSIVEGDTVDMNDAAYMRQALIFHENPETGEFTYLGTEEVSTPW